MSELRFHDCVFDPATNDLRIQNGEPVHVAPEPAMLLSELLNHRGQTVSKDQLKTSVWGSSGRMSDATLQQVVRRLRNCLRDNEQKIVQTNKTLGYFIAVEPGAAAEPVPEPLSIFAGQVRSRDGRSIPSWLGSGKEDRVYPALAQLPKQQQARPQIPLHRNDAERLAIRFEHRPSASEECWWAGVLPFGITEDVVRWPLVDLTAFNKLGFRASFEAAEGASSEMLLGVRLEDGTNRTTVSSRHNQTGWYPEDLRVGLSWHSYVLNLDNFIWTEYAWPTNWRSVDRMRMLQIDFGQDAQFPAARGALYLAEIRILP